ncbi:glucose-6-phosphate dehydrogenase [Nostoc sp. MG11]|uniref:glucose-6-phosphate dehydrogenase n=1 Tax=Nostoc sp. MG11 TaxID=2721166 RepID=UPI0018689E4C|nr:glucose-6-phosphate dehydrogenase [Nostoc sp. MG11]
MTAINLATDIPSQINTVEKLHSWTGNLLANVNPALMVIEGVSYTERAAQWGRFWIPADVKTREIIRLSLAVSADWTNGSGKPWTFVQELSTTAIPANFKAN